MSTLYVRLRKQMKSGVVINSTYTVHGMPFVAGQWAIVPEVIQLSNGKTFRPGDYLEELRTNDGMQPLFDVTDEAGAKRIEAVEVEKAERAARARKVATAGLSQVERAVMLGAEMAVPDAKAALKDDGAETFTPDELEEAKEIIRARRAATSAAKASQKADDSDESDEQPDEGNAEAEGEGRALPEEPLSERKAKRNARMGGSRGAGKETAAT